MHKVRSFEEVLATHERMIYYLINKWSIRDPEKEFYQEATIALWQAYESYDPARGKFSTYAYFHIEKALLSVIRKQTRQQEKQEMYILMEKSDPGRVVTFLQEGIDPYLLARLENVLTDKQMTWFQLYVLEDLSVKAIAQKEKVTTAAVKNWARAAKPKIRRVLCADG
ncbi:sigma-70 family RNA polymerase sigma factor [Sediminibacillus halophilus]|uniref:RNA polymerase sigma factor, sigma-70 family n=1 Tax=Sediminibacillus halophilus TaxID=482461 RepID=A0A1G9UFA7_9BACI|nr:sigma-70 family RNA polymerase sigma factor [Sediminibacillus halophilus]SDM58647.1 RNA polymerase sigma factor, sigma-70 family [Sediminibacillus halophilus]